MVDNPENQRLYEAMMKMKPLLAFMRVFESTCFAHALKGRRIKCGDATVTWNLLGHSEGPKEYRDINQSQVIYI
jgi:hypothetical protein